LFSIPIQFIAEFARYQAAAADANGAALPAIAVGATELRMFETHSHIVQITPATPHAKDHTASGLLIPAYQRAHIPPAATRRSLFFQLIRHK